MICTGYFNKTRNVLKNHWFRDKMWYCLQIILKIALCRVVFICSHCLQDFRWDAACCRRPKALEITMSPRAPTIQKESCFTTPESGTACALHYSRPGLLARAKEILLFLENFEVVRPVVKGTFKINSCHQSDSSEGMRVVIL